MPKVAVLDKDREALDFSPDILRLQHSPPSPMPRAVLLSLITLFGCMLLWATFGRLDIIAVAQGKLVPKSALKIVQPADSGIVKVILVGEGDQVHAGQVLVRMDTQYSDADSQELITQLNQLNLQLRRIDAELNGTPLMRLAKDPPNLYSQIQAQYLANRQAFQDALEEEKSMHDKAEQDYLSAKEIENKLKQTVPIYREQDQAYNDLSKEGYSPKLIAMEKNRDYIEKLQELHSQTFNVESLRSNIVQSEKRLAQITSSYHQQLQKERADTESQYQKLKQEWEKQAHRQDLLELKAPQDGIIKDLSTHTPGTVVSPGTILMTVVPNNDLIEAEVWVTHLDAGFVEAKQPVKVKLAAYPFQKYGMIKGEVEQLSPDAIDSSASKGDQATQPLGYRTIVSLETPYLESEGKRYKLSPGMQVSAEINLGNRSVLEYLFSPIRKTMHDAGRER